MKRLLLLLVIGLAGVGIAFGASTVIFNPTSGERDISEPDGLISDLPTAAPESTASPSPSPTPTAAPAAPSGGGQSSGSQAPSDGARTPATPASIHVMQGETKKSDASPDPDDFEAQCADEKNERERDRCVDELEAEADEEEEERKQEEEEAEEKAKEKADEAKEDSKDK